MSDDQRDDRGEGKRDGAGRGHDMDDMFARPPGGDGGGDRTASDDTGDADAGGDDYLAAKQERVRRRREEMRRRRRGLPVPSDDAEPATAAGGGRPGRPSALPALRPDPSDDTPAMRADRVEAIRRDLVRRRRRKGLGTLLKLMLFVVAPTLAVGTYLYVYASDLYRSESSFAVKNADPGPAAGGGISALFGASAMLYDPVAVQTYLESRDVLRRLNAEHGWIAHYQNPELDWWHRLPVDATFEDAFDQYRRFTEVSFDPTEGIIRLSLVAATPDHAREFSRAIIGYAEEQIDQLSSRIRGDALEESEAYFTRAEANLRAAQLALAEAQKLSDVFSVESEVAAQMALIGQLESQREAEKAKLAGLMRATSANDPRVKRREAAIVTLDKQIANLREKISGGNANQTSLADINARLVSAKLDVETKLAIFTSALQRVELARSEAARQTRYLAMVSSPSYPDRANYPRKLELTAMAFLGFLGLYIIGSLTISLIREQASI